MTVPIEGSTASLFIESPCCIPVYTGSPKVCPCETLAGLTCRVLALQQDQQSHYQLLSVLWGHWGLTPALPSFGGLVCLDLSVFALTFCLEMH